MEHGGYLLYGDGSPPPEVQVRKRGRPPASATGVGGGGAASASGRQDTGGGGRASGQDSIRGMLMRASDNTRCRRALDGVLQGVVQDVARVMDSLSDRVLESVDGWVADAFFRWQMSGGLYAERGTEDSRAMLPTGLLVGCGASASIFEELRAFLQARGACHVALIHARSCNARGSGGLLVALKMISRQLMGADAFAGGGRDGAGGGGDMASLIDWYRSVSAEAGVAPKPMVVVLEDTENFHPQLLQDLSLLLAEHRHELPIHLMLGLDTNATAIHQMLGYSGTVRLSTRVFQLPSAEERMEAFLEDVVMSGRHEFFLANPVVNFLQDHVAEHSFSVESFSTGIKLAAIEHHNSQELSFLCRPVQSLAGCESLCAGISDSDLSDFNALPSMQATGLPPFDRASMAAVLWALHVHARLRGAFVRWLRVALKTLSKTGRNAGLDLLTLLRNFNQGGPLTRNDAMRRFVANLGGCSLKDCQALATAFRRMLEEDHALVSHAMHSEIEELEGALDAAAAGSVAVGGGGKSAEEEASAPATISYTWSTGKRRRELLASHTAPASRHPSQAASGELFTECFSSVAERLLIPIEGLPGHEVLCFADHDKLRSKIAAGLRTGPMSSLRNPLKHFPNLVREDASGAVSIVDDTAFAFQLLSQATGNIVNLHDWYEQFCEEATALDCVQRVSGGKDKVKPGQLKGGHTPELQARFTRATNELQLLGIIRSTQRKTDHVARMVF